MPDLVIRGGTVVTPEGVRELDVAVEQERIATLADPGTLAAEADRVIDAEGLLVLPGGVDPHVHYSLGFGTVTAEGQEHSAAAACGGTTTIVDFALQEAPSTLHDAIAAKRTEADGRMAVDYGLHAILAGPEIAFEVLEEIADVVRAGIPTIKTFMTYGWMVDDGFRLGAMLATAAAGGMSVVHAEDDAVANWLTARALREGRTHGAYIAEVRGPFVEEAAVRRAMLLAEHAGCPLYVLHVGAGSAVRALAEGRSRGLPLYAETLTPYLSFSSEDLWREPDGLLHNNYPVPKSLADQAELWEALADDRLQAIGSDHFAISRADHYERMGTTVDSMMAGHPNVELRFPVTFSLGVAGGRLALERFVDLIATNPAKLMGLHPRKGVIQRGSDADLVVFDPASRWTVRAQELHMSSDYSCWEGWELTGRVVHTLLRGRVVVEDGRFVGDRGGGRYLERTLAPEVLDGSVATMPEPHRATA